MESVFQYIISIVGLIIGTGGSILFYKSNKRLEAAKAATAEIETTNHEIDGLKEVIDKLRQEVDRLDERLKSTEARLKEKDSLVGDLYRDIESLMMELHKYRKAVSCGHLCTKPANECPIRKSLIDSGINLDQL